MIFPEPHPTPSMKNVFLPLAVVALFAGCASYSDKPSASAKPYPLNTCIVSGDKLGEMGTPVVRVVNGQEVKLCCKDCLNDFDKDPVKYLTKLDAK